MQLEIWLDKQTNSSKLNDSTQTDRCRETFNNGNSSEVFDSVKIFSCLNVTEHTEVIPSTLTLADLWPLWSDGGWVCIGSHVPVWECGQSQSLYFVRMDFESFLYLFNDPCHRYGGFRTEISSEFVFFLKQKM